MRHGTRYAWFKGGCRCDECREGRAADDRDRRQRRFDRAKADPSIIKHGTSLAYTDYGCRCPACTDARTAESRRRTGRSAARKWTDQEITTALDLYRTQGREPAAKMLGVNPGTVTRWAKARGITYEHAYVHGTRAGYVRGCRCRPCLDATAVAQGLAKERMRANQDQAPHGTSSGYTNWSCRCDPCKAAGAVQNAKTRARRIARQNS